MSSKCQKMFDSLQVWSTRISIVWGIVTVPAPTPTSTPYLRDSTHFLFFPSSVLPQHLCHTLQGVHLLLTGSLGFSEAELRGGREDKKSKKEKNRRGEKWLKTIYIWKCWGPGSSRREGVVVHVPQRGIFLSNSTEEALESLQNWESWLKGKKLL